MRARKCFAALEKELTAFREQSGDKLVTTEAAEAFIDKFKHVDAYPACVEAGATGPEELGVTGGLLFSLLDRKTGNSSQRGRAEAALRKLDAKAVIMIGTNNLGSNSPDEIAEGIKVIVDKIRHKQPQTKILLLGIFPQAPADGQSTRQDQGH